MDLQLLMEGRCFTLYSLEQGQSAADFLHELKREDEDEYDRISRRLEHLADHGPSRRLTEYNELGQGLYEAKSKGGSRVVFFYDKNRIVICAGGFGKRSQKTPKHILKTVRSRKSDYELHKAGGQGFNILVPPGRLAPRRLP